MFTLAEINQFWKKGEELKTKQLNKDACNIARS